MYHIDKTIDLLSAIHKITLKKKIEIKLVNRTPDHMYF